MNEQYVQLKLFDNTSIIEKWIASSIPLLKKMNIELLFDDFDDKGTGSICIVERATKDEEVTRYRIRINHNSSPEIQFTALVHELAHLVLGHLGPNETLDIHRFPKVTHTQQELEAEMVAGLVCGSFGVKSDTLRYLKKCSTEDMTVDDTDFVRVIRASTQLEIMLAPLKKKAPSSKDLVTD